MSLIKIQSTKLFEKAKTLMPGGVNSPVRSFKSVGGTPHFMEKGDGPYVFDADGNRFLDFTASWGPLILGHSHPKIKDAVINSVEQGTTFGTPTKRENTLAQMVIDAVPSIEKVRFVNSGTEATMSAVRLARGYTHRDLIIKFEGCYHGHGDFFLSNAGSGLATFDQPSSPGIPKAVVESTITVPYNDLNAVREAFEGNPSGIAAIILEPIAGNMGVVAPSDGFLQGLRDLCTEFDAVLIFDEVITGFRVAHGGAQKVFNVLPDLTTLGKIIGGGLPVGAYGGKAEIMAYIAPEGPVYQAGTLSGNPISMAGGIATLKELNTDGLYEELEEMGSYFADGLRQVAAENNIPIKVNQFGSMVGLFFTDSDINNFSDVANSEIETYNSLHGYLLDNNIYFPPSGYETFFVSTAHSKEHIDAVKRVFGEFCAGLG
ncbi:MAG: glutamate-1-semialdehyde 2,1-aminomutase [Candidatus Marinimicrobia bacterium]|nr:glutamate-1-semialdehyde 2,1-aminomutase [Candidatus Neomarinimicrobiota bacterium]